MRSMDQEQQKWIMDALDLAARATEKKAALIIVCRDANFDEIVITNATSPAAIMAMRKNYGDVELKEESNG